MKNSIPPRYRKLVNAAVKARKNAHAPYSKFKVGSAVLTDTGKIYAGCNVENASYGLTLCAERIAIGKAVSEGASNFEAIAVVVDTRVPVAPCGACRQSIFEFGKKITVIIVTTNGKTLVQTISNLLPYGFDESHL